GPSPLGRPRGGGAWLSSGGGRARRLAARVAERGTGSARVNGGCPTASCGRTGTATAQRPGVREPGSTAGVNGRKVRRGGQAGGDGQARRQGRGARWRRMGS